MVEGKSVESGQGAVAARPPEAARTGVRMLELGGNAMDAISASCLAGCLIWPEAAGLGGYVGSAVVRTADTGTDTGRVWAIDSNSVAPAAARDGMYRITQLNEYNVVKTAGSQGSEFINETEYACRVQDNSNVFGPLASGVPGAMAAIGVIWERWGRLSWKQVVEPSLELIGNGLEVRGPDGIEHLADLEKTLKRIAREGWRDLYSGDIGRKIARAVQDSGGILTSEDMAGFEPRVTEPLTTNFRNASVHSAILPNGGLSCLQALNMMECFDPVSYESALYWHRLAEIYKRVWRDRTRYLGDPDFTEVPMDRLLDKNYAAGRIETIRQFPDNTDLIKPAGTGESTHGTFHMSSADIEGNLASVTLSHGGAFGSKFVVPGTGIVLGHGMCRFDPRPGLPNSVGSGKRPLNNTCPLIVCLDDRYIATGLPGGRRIISASAQMVQRMVESGVSGYEAAVSPRLHAEISEPVWLSKNADEGIAEGLRELGHTVKRGPVAGSAHCAEVLFKQNKVRAGGETWAAGVEE